MKRLTIALSIAALALPLCAQDRPNTTETVLAKPPAAQNEDSPLVKAAKATGRLNKKPSIVITNETLLKSGGHLFVANQTPNPPLPVALPKADPGLAQADAAMKAKAAADAKSKQQAAAKKDAKLKAAAADFYGESIEEHVDDPAQQEHVMNQMTSTQPQTSTSAQPQTATPSKPPQN